MIPTTNTSTAPDPVDHNPISLKPRDPSLTTATIAASSADRLAVEGLSISTGPLPHEIYPPPQLEEYHQDYRQQQQQQQQQYQQQQHQQQQHLQQPHLQQPQHQQRVPPQIPPRPPAHMQYQPSSSYNTSTTPAHPKTMTTITATVTTNDDDTRSVAFEEAKRLEQKRTQRSTQLPPTVAAKVLTPAQQREAEADAYIQRAIELHENNELKEATYYFRLAAHSENPVGQLMYGLSLRHGWGCDPNPKEAIFYLQRAAEYAMGELKELSPASSANIQAIQRHTSRNQQNRAGAHSAANVASSTTHNQQQQQQQQSLKRMGTIDRRSAMLTARKELVMALYELGMSFLKGWGVEKNKVVAFHYFKLGADLGDPDSQNETALCFLDGIGTDKNAFEAARYYRLASAQGASQLGNSWIWKPKYDQYCEQQAAALAAESAERKIQQHQQQPMSGGAGTGNASSTTTATPYHNNKPSSPPTSPTSNSIAAGLASMTVAGAMATPSATAAAASSILTSPPQTPSSKIRLSMSVAGRNTGAHAAPGAPSAAAGPGGPARQGRYSLAGDLISSSQLELKLRQAEELTHATIGSSQGGSEAAAKKKHRWSLWNHRRGPSSS